jgi:hypothetical protein
MSIRRTFGSLAWHCLLAGCSALTRTDASNPRADNGAHLKHPWEVDPQDPTQRYN